jgi:hypothetical protein
LGRSWLRRAGSLGLLWGDVGHWRIVSVRVGRD